MHKSCKKHFLAKLSETTHACKVLHKLKQEKKHLALDKKKSLLCYNHFLTVQYLDGPSGRVERGALTALAVTGLLPEH